MRFELNEDQAVFADALGKMLSQTEFKTVEHWGRFDYGEQLDAMLENNGFYDTAREEDLGTVAAALMVYETAQSPVCVECAASCMIRPFLGRNDVPRPLAVTVDNAASAIRYLPYARGLVSIATDGVRYAAITPGAVTQVESLYAYPMGTIDTDNLRWETIGRFLRFS